MFFGRIRKFFSSLSFRVTFWFVGVFSVLLFLLLVAFYYLLKVQVYRGTDTALLYELGEAYVVYQSGGMDALVRHIDEESKEAGQDRVFFRVFDQAGKRIIDSNLTSWGTVPVNWEVINRLSEKETWSETMQLPKHQEFARVVSYGLSEDTVIQGGLYVKQELDLLDNYKRILPLVGFCIVLLAALIGFYVVHQLVLRVESIRRLAGIISSSNLKERVPLQGKGDEIDRLADGFNRMLDRIENLVKEMTQVTDDVAHDLRSPLTRIRVGAEVALRSNTLNVEGQEAAINTIEECDHVLELINSMLDISQIDAEIISFTMAPVDFTSVVSDAVELFEAVAADKNISLTVRHEENAWVQGHLGKLQRIVSNIIDNAIKFTPAGGSITVTLQGEGDTVLFACSDTGIGIAEEETGKVFQRFYRGDSSRTKSGYGLGLPLCQSLVKAHGGSISLTSTAGRGTTVSFTLPRLLHQERKKRMRG